MPAQSCTERHAATRVTEAEARRTQGQVNAQRRVSCRRSRARMLPFSTSSHRTASIHTATRVTAAEARRTQGQVNAQGGLVAGAVMHGTRTTTIIASSLQTSRYIPLRGLRRPKPAEPKARTTPKGGLVAGAVTYGAFSPRSLNGTVAYCYEG